jgi:hypothetical protein
MPWHDCLMPINQDYHAVERAVHTAAMAGCNTIWIVLHRETQPLIKKKITSWLYDPTHVWDMVNPFFSKKEIPVYYVAINPKDRNRRDSQAWSALYGARVASYISLKISRWVVPKRFLVVSPYGVTCEESIRKCRLDLKGSQNIAFTYNGKTFLEDEHLPFTFDDEQYKICKEHFRINYTGDDSHKTFKELFSVIDAGSYRNVAVDYHYNISNWDGYKRFLGSEHNNLCERPKYLVKHKWHGFVPNK